MDKPGALTHTSEDSGAFHGPQLQAQPSQEDCLSLRKCARASILPSSLTARQLHHTLVLRQGIKELCFCRLGDYYFLTSNNFKVLQLLKGQT